MSVPAEEMARRRVPVGRPAVQQLALPPPQPVPPAPDVVAVDSAGRASVSNVQPRAPTAAGTGPAPAARPATMFVSPNGQAAEFLRSPSNATRLPPGVTGPVGPTPVVNPALSPNTAASAMGAPPASPTPAPAAPPAAAEPVGAARRAGQVAGKAQRAAGAAARMGTSPAANVGKIRGGAGSLLGLAGIGSFLQSWGTPSEQFAQRTGIEGGTVPRDVLNRTLGALSDLGANVADPLIGAGNALGRGVESVWPGAPEAFTQQAPTLRSRFRDTQAQEQFQAPSAEQLAAAAPAAPAAPATSAAPAPAPPGTPTTQPAAAAPSSADVLGTWQGEQIDRGEADRLAGQLNVVPAYQGTAASQMGGAPQRREPGFNMPRDTGRDTIERIDKTISDIGPLDRRGRRQAVADLLGLRGRIETGDLDRASVEQRAGADVAQRSAASELGAEVDREQIAAASSNARRQNTQMVTGADGITYAVGENNALTPLTTPDGQPLRAATKQDTSIQDLAAKLLEQSVASGLVTDPNAAAIQAAETARALQSATNSPPGMTYIGTQNGKPVYQDAQGRRFVDE